MWKKVNFPRLELHAKTFLNWDDQHIEVELKTSASKVPL